MSVSITSPQRLRDAHGETHEYVVSLTDRQACALRYIAHERVIRCQDCAVATINPDGSIDHECDLVGTWAESEWNPDGFCAWSKPKEES